MRVRCQTDLKAVRNLTRFGRFAALECPQHHGQYQSFSLLLAERGLVRPIAAQDRQILRQEQRALECLNCGAIQPNEAGSQSLPQCTHCDSPLVMIDLPKLTQALLVRHGDVLHIDAAAQRLALACTGCGAALDPTQDMRCGHCDAPVALPSLRGVAALLDRVEPLLRGQAPRQAQPWGEKLARMQGDHTHTLMYRLLHTLRRDLLGASTDSRDWRTVLTVVSIAIICWLLLR
jgi:Zn finger protein HypA/HybF involved in hydrogenase expression